MQFIFEDKKKRQIIGQEEIKFSSFSSFHLIKITARVKSKKETGNAGEKLNLKIDDKSFSSQAEFLGSKLRNLAQTIYFLLYLRGGNHKIILQTDKQQKTATLENLEVYTLGLEQIFNLKTEDQAEDGDRRPWVTFVLDNLPMVSFTAGITYSRRKRDSDDIKIIIDGQTQRNLVKTFKHFLWHFVGSFLPVISPRKTETETFNTNLAMGTHYIEFWADRMPILHEMAFDFGNEPSTPKDIPTADSPKWTGNFYDDPPGILLSRIIFGEAGNQSREVKIAVGWSVKNRIGKGELIYPGKVYNNFHDVILDENQYASLTDPSVRLKLEDPFDMENPIETKSWYESYKIASAIISNKVPDPTDEALFFHDDRMTTAEFLIRVPRAVYIKKIGDILFYGVKS